MKGLLSSYSAAPGSFDWGSKFASLLKKAENANGVARVFANPIPSFSRI